MLESLIAGFEAALTLQNVMFISLGLSLAVIEGHLDWFRARVKFRNAKCVGQSRLGRPGPQRLWLAVCGGPTGQKDHLERRGNAGVFGGKVLAV